MICWCAIAQLAHYLATRLSVLLAVRGTHIRKKVKFSTAKSTPRPVHRVLVDIVCLAQTCHLRRDRAPLPAKMTLIRENSHLCAGAAQRSQVDNSAPSRPNMIYDIASQSSRRDIAHDSEAIQENDRSPCIKKKFFSLHTFLTKIKKHPHTHLWTPSVWLKPANCAPAGLLSVHKWY